ncbi:uncharacterized protein TRIADDRAFT_62339 [Trichoplax adhaerens]|uniref:Serine aminopeptidase S33 domain-containing protein n=1 Tax=Trichoplax adhaerens TaxID=10228 RepID=B3SDI1_TRIAD|nr:hypothetical protein TRIADDRAFT_62339 [Trichoplax adhaerens]EDV19221.1 hypothetical protein TRIADDRAFT_62339 [Trichoplax adhaerens]|eukprot:XP_002118287.1 hypothetical protein TRIADDRAFT_62339 [Trichoplax adhaerens]
MRRHGFVFIDRIIHFATNFIHSIWRSSSAALLLLLLAYWFYGDFTIFLLLCLAILGTLYQYQDSLLYYPDQPSSSRMFVQQPYTIGLPSENLYLRTADGVRINAVFIKQPPVRLPFAPTIMFIHGNAGNIGHRLPFARELYHHCGVNVMLLEYRGYGKSDGVPSENGLKLDARAGLEYLRDRTDIDASMIIVFGRSLGGAVGIDLACQQLYTDAIRGLIVENSFTSIPAMGEVLFSALRLLPMFCFRNKFNSKSIVKSVRVPTLFLSGLSDELVPPRMMTELCNKSGAIFKRIVRFENGSHNGTWLCPDYYKCISFFIAQELNSKALVAP